MGNSREKGKFPTSGGKYIRGEQKKLSPVSKCAIASRFLLCVILLVSMILVPVLYIGANASNVSTVTNLMTSLKQSTKSSIYNTSLNAPFSKTTSGVRETVSTETGAMTANNKLLSIPGRAGMDLELNLVYSNQNAKLWDEGTSSPSITNSYNTTIIAFYEVYNSNGYWLRTGALQYAANETTILGSTTINGETWVFNGYMQYATGNSLLKSGSIVNATHEKKLTDQSNVFGAGWSLDLPSLYIDTNSVYVTLSDGQTYLYDSSTATGLKNYLLSDVRFTTDTSVSNGTDTSAYKLRYGDGHIEYFTSNGEILLETDRYGNQITYYWTATGGQRLLTKIVDSAGRIVTLDYNNTGTTIRYGAKTISLLKTPIPGAAGKYCLSSYINANGDKTSYSYSFDSASFDLLGKTAAANTYANLSSITYQTGLRTSYTYSTSAKNLGDSGSMSYFKVAKRWDSYGDKAYSTQEYFYSGAPDGYPTYKPTTIPMSYTYSTKVCNMDGTTDTYLYNYKHLLSQTDSVTKILTTTSKMLYDANQNVPIRKTVMETANGVSSVTSVDTYEYNSMGNLVSENHPDSPKDLDSGEYVTKYTYDSTYDIMTGKSYKQDANTTITQKYILTDDKKSVAESTTNTNGALTAHSYYRYASNGNLLQSASELKENQWAIAKYTYGYEYYQLFPTVVQSLEAQSADGVNATELSSKTCVYDFSTGDVLRSTDGNGNITCFDYDVLDRVIKQTMPDGSYRTTKYDDIKNTLLTTDAAGGTLLYNYDPQGNLSTVTKTLTGEVIISKSYDTKGNLISSTDANGNAYGYTYDVLNRMTTSIVTDVNGAVVSKKIMKYEDNADDGYGDLCQKITITVCGDLTNLVNSYYYNGRGQLMKESRVSDTAEQFKSYGIDYLGNVLTTTNYDGALTTCTYNSIGEVLTNTDPNGNTTHYGYDMLGNCVSGTNAKGVTVYSQYNALGKLISMLIPEDNGTFDVTKYTYDEDGNLVRTVDAKGNVTNRYYNSRNFLTAVEQVETSNKSFIVKLDYDAEGRETARYTGLSSWDDPYFSTQTKTYDAYGQLTEDTDMAGKKTAYQYDGNGNLTSSTDRNGVKTINSYDGLNRLIAKYNSKDGTGKAITYTYDLNGAMKSNADSSSAAKYSYDGFGRVTKIRYDNNVIKAYNYDDGDRVTSFKVSVGGGTELAENYEYDAGGRKTAVVFKGVRSTYTYDAANELTSETNGLTGAKTNYSYTASGEIKTLRTYLSGQLESDYEYKYDSVGNQTEKDDNGNVTTYTYDALSRLSTANMPNGVTQNYIYDDYGNISSLAEICGNKIAETKYLYDNAGRLTLKSCDADGTQSRFQYDKCGNLTFEEDVTKQTNISVSYDTSYMYNGFNQLSLVTAPDGGHYEYTYDSEGLRNAKISDSGKTGFVCENGNDIIETDANGRVTAKNVWGIHLLERDTSDGVYTYLYNGHGDITALTDEHGKTLEDYDYDPYGNETSTAETATMKNSWQAPAEYNNPFRYCGEYYDLSSGTYYLRARYYDPSIGRFLSEDTYTGKTTDPLSLNLYTYCQDNPIRYIDPSGNSKNDIAYGITRVLDENNCGGAVEWLVKLISGNGNGVRQNDSEYDYYEGRVIGDVLSGIIGAGESAEGIATIINSVLAGGAITIGSGGTLTFGGVAVSAAGAGAGAILVTYGGTVMRMSSANFSSDYSKVQDLGKTEYKKPISGSGKEKATDVPSWAKGNAPLKSENGKEFSTRLMNEKYGKGKWSTSNPEYSKIKKWGDRNFA